jgi:hypothetical protein
VPELYLDLLSEWEHGPFRPDGFRHVEHLQVAWTLLHIDEVNALERLQRGTRRACEVHGAPERFDAELTQHWFDALANAIRDTPGCENLERLLAAHPELRDGQRFT